MKPRLFKQGGIWWCRIYPDTPGGLAEIYSGSTPEFAYYRAKMAWKDRA